MEGEKKGGASEGRKSLCHVVKSAYNSTSNLFIKKGKKRDIDSKLFP